MSVHALPDDDGVRVLRAHGEVDVSVVPATLPEIARLVAGAGGVVLDLTEVTFFDSAGVRLVDRLSRECSLTETPFRVAAPPGGAARHVLELVSLAQLVADDDLETAVRRVRG